MTRLHIYEPGKGLRHEEGCAHLHEHVADPNTIVWVELEAPSDAEIDAVEGALAMHSLAREDLVEEEDRPRIRQYNDVISITLFAVHEPKPDAEELAFERVNLFVTRQTLVTVAKAPLPDLKEACDRWKDNIHFLNKDAGAVLYAVLDTVMDGYFPAIDHLADRVDDVEDQVVQHTDGSMVQDIFKLKRSMLAFRRVASGSRDVVNALLRHESLFDEQEVLFFQDLYDHAVRITDSVDTYRDLLSNALDMYLSATSNRLAESANRLNETMQTLTSWSIILGTGAVITGMYGMNVEGIPFAHSHHGFVATVVVMLIVAGILLILFRRKKWI